jgi:hypothetical protein
MSELMWVNVQRLVREATEVVDGEGPTQRLWTLA